MRARGQWLPMVLVVLALGSAVAAADEVDGVREIWGDSGPRVCIVCGLEKATPEHSDLHRGRVVPVCGACWQHYQDDKETILAGLQPRSALFHDEVVERPQVSWLVFGLGAWVTFGLLCGALAGGIAGKRGHPAWRYVLIGVAGNVVAIVLALGLERRDRAIADIGLKSPTTRAPVPCDAPGCDQSNHPSATRCSGCGRALDPTVRSEVEATGAA